MSNRLHNNGIVISDKIGYGVGNFGFGIVFQIVASYLVFFATAILKVPGSFIGLVISISVIWDALSDPMMGFISDNTKFRFLGRRHIYILIGTIGIAVCNYFLWMIDSSLSTSMKFVWILVDVMLLKTFMTIFVTPYTALGAELSSDYDERSSIQAIKTSFFLLGIFFASAMGMLIIFQPSPSYPIGQLNPEAYKNMALSSSSLMLLFGLGCFWITKKYIPELPVSSEEHSKLQIMSLFKSFKNMIKNVDYRSVFLGYLFTNTASAFITTIGLHVFTYTFLMDNIKIGIILGVQLLISILSQPIWIALSKKMDKKPAVMLGLYISITASFVFILLVIFKDLIRINYTYLLLFSVLAGFGAGGLFTLPLSMIADTTDQEELRSGIRKEGMFFGGLTLGYKLSQSVAIFLLGIVLDLVKFNPNLEMQAEQTTIVLGLLVPVGCIVSFIAAIRSYKQYSLTKHKVRRIQLRIADNKCD